MGRMAPLEMPQSAAHGAPLDSRGRVLSIAPIGNVGNRMLQYMAICGFGRLLGEKVLINCDLPEWGCVFDAGLHERLAAPDSGAISVLDRDVSGPLDLLSRLIASRDDDVVFSGTFQRLELFHAPDFYRTECFPLLGENDDPNFGENDLVINVRAGEIVDGISWYPLVPVEFYEYIVRVTGKNPIFLGQLDDSPYVAAISRAFPDARMIPSAGPLIDMALLRQARHLCLAVSTFSWLAAFLSEAETIHYPVLGFLHPRCFLPGRHGLGGIDLLPVDDPRYRFHLFPWLEGEAFARYVDRIAVFTPISREISRRHAAMLKEPTPFMPGAGDRHAVDSRWYLRNYPDAAWDIAEGWCADCVHHYTAVGRNQGYAPHAPLYRPVCPDLARGGAASQSTHSVWSVGRTVEADAARALDGNRDKLIGFHTSCEWEPWWMVDLGAVSRIECVTIYNRHSWDIIRARTVPFTLEFSLSGLDWDFVVKSPDAFDFGADQPPSVPWQWVSDFDRMARYVRVRLEGRREVLHLTAVEVYGQVADSA